MGLWDPKWDPKTRVAWRELRGGEGNSGCLDARRDRACVLPASAYFVYIVLMGTKHIGELEQMVLLAITRLGSDAYGMAVLRELESRADRVVSRGALYLVLERMVQKGYLSTRLGEPTPGRGGRAKRFFELTEVGREAIRVSGRSLRALWEGMDFLLEEGS